MPSNKKDTKQPKAARAKADAGNTLPSGLPVLVPAKPVAASKPAKPAARKPSSASAKASKKTAPVSKKKPARPHIPTEEISLRAYYIAERRQRMGWPGDSTSDWVEAERQLIAELTKKSS